MHKPRKKVVITNLSENSAKTSHKQPNFQNTPQLGLAKNSLFSPL
jgi:hypothetical protein